LEGGNTGFLGNVTTDETYLWAKEIRNFLLGRLSTNSVVVPLLADQRLTIRHNRIRRWWIFEGKHFPVLGGNIASNWDRAKILARALDQTYNPRLRLNDRIDAFVDWPATIARGLGQTPRSYVVRTSGIGLNEDERAALCGWIGWVDGEWSTYSNLSKPSIWRGYYKDIGTPSDSQLRRWLHISRRSRWPFLRQVVAETLRPSIEPVDLDRIPLPSDRATLFELLCLVRIAQQVAKPPNDLRWFDHTICNNTLELCGATLLYQYTLDSQKVLETPWYAGGLASAVRVFNLSLPRRVDLIIEFPKPRNEFDGIIVEAKSGDQSFEATIHQLRIYSSAYNRRPGSHYLCWGIVERAKEKSVDLAGTAHLRRGAIDGDLWAFSGPEAIPDVLNSVGLSIK